MKKVTLILFYVLVNISITMGQYTLTDDDVVIENGVIISCSYNFNQTDIIIPSILDEQIITGIGYDNNNSIFDEKGITSVEFPSNIDSIANNAFYHNNITDIIIPNSLTYIGNKAFAKNIITNITIPSSVTYIGGGAFNNNKITIINGQLSNGIIYARNSNGSINYNKIISYGGEVNNIDFIPNSVDTIGDYAFEQIFLYNVSIPNSITHIGVCAFWGDNLTNITIPNSVIYIGRGAFSYNGFTNLSIPNSVTTIEPYAFSHNQLTNITIPNSVTTIGYKAFSFNQLNNVNFEANSHILSIGPNVFSNNDNLNQIILPTNINQGFIEYRDNVENIYVPGDSIFNFSLMYFVDMSYTLTDDDVVVENGVIISCSYNFAIKNIIIPNILDGQTITSIGDSFANKSIYTIQLPTYLEYIGTSTFRNNMLKNITIPSSVTYIGDAAFSDNFLTSITIPSSVTYIGAIAFRWNFLTSITIPSSVIYIGQGAFQENYSLTSVNFEPNSNILNIGIAAFYPKKIVLPTNANSGFINYIDGNNNNYNPGDTVIDIFTWYKTVLDSHSVYFIINDGVDIIPNANIVFNNIDFVADSNGKLTISNIIDGTYNYTVSVNGYADTSGTITVNGIDVYKTISLVYISIKEINEKTFKIYPNPVHNQLTINNEQLIIENIEILDITGKTIKQLIIGKEQLIIGKEQLIINISSLGKGMYFIKIKTTEGYFIKQFIKQ